MPQQVYHAIEQQAAQQLAGVPIDSAVDRSAILRLGYILVAVVALGTLYRILSPKDPFTSAARVLMPWSDITFPSLIDPERIGESSLDNAQATMDRAAAAAALLRDTAGIADARHFERHELVALLEPWLGAGNVSPELPLPGLIDVVVAPGACPDPRALELALQEIAPGARVDAHGQWLERFAATARTLQVVAQPCSAPTPLNPNNPA